MSSGERAFYTLFERTPAAKRRFLRENCMEHNTTSFRKSLEQIATTILKEKNEAVLLCDLPAMHRQG